MISAWTIYANGELWDLLNGGAITHYAARIFLTNRTFTSEDGPITARTLGLMIGRHIDGGMHEDIDITNNGLRAVRFNLEIAIRADFADILEVKSGRIVRRGTSRHPGRPLGRHYASLIATRISTARSSSASTATAVGRRLTPTADLASTSLSKPGKPGIAA